MLLLCSVKGKTQYYEERFKGTHVRVSAEETFRAQPHVSLHRVVNVVLSHIQGGKSVVIDDTNSKKATRMSYIRALRNRLEMCPVLCIHFKPIGDVLQCQWQNEWKRAASLAIKENGGDDVKSVSTATPEAWDAWMADHDPPVPSEGFDEIKVIDCPLQSYSSIPFDTKGLMLDIEAVLEFNHEGLGDTFFGGNLQEGEWIKLRDGVNPILSDYREHYPLTRFIVVINEASIIPNEVYLLEPAQQDIQFLHFRKRLLAELSKLPVSMYYLYLPRRASIHSTFIKPPLPGFIAWLQERHRLSLGDTVFVGRDDSPLYAAAKDFVACISGNLFFSSSGWMIPSKLRMYSREPTTKQSFLNSTTLSCNKAADSSSSVLPLCHRPALTGDRSESISDVLVHGIVLNASTAGGAYMNDSPPTSTSTTPTHRMTPSSHQKEEREGGRSPSTMPTTPSEHLCPSPRRRLPGWMSPGASKPSKLRIPKLGESDGDDGENKFLATPKKKKSAPSIRAVSSPKKEEKEEAHPKKDACENELKEEQEDSASTENLLLFLSRMEDDVEENETSFPTVASGKRKRELPKMASAEENDQEQQQEEHQVPRKKRKNSIEEDASWLRPTPPQPINTKLVEDCEDRVSSPPHTPLRSASAQKQAAQMSSTPSANNPTNDEPLHQGSESAAGTSLAICNPATPTKPRVKLRDQLLECGLLSPNKKATTEENQKREKEKRSGIIY